MFDIRIDENGEVQFRSPGMFSGYYKEKASPPETLTPDGYVKTGDAGFFDTDGQLKIIDRAKGRRASFPPTARSLRPKYIENKLKFFPNIKEVVAFGDGRAFCAVFLNHRPAGGLATGPNATTFSYGSYQELAQHPQVRQLIAADVDEANRRLSAEPMWLPPRFAAS